MILKTNNECLTFEEWACAAGAAKFTPTNDEFIPMGEGYTYFVAAKLTQRKYRYNYPANIRKAWADGVDPTDWKASLDRTDPMYGRRW